MLGKLWRFIRNIWQDPVFSNVIAVGLVAAIGGLFYHFFPEPTNGQVASNPESSSQSLPIEDPAENLPISSQPKPLHITPDKNPDDIHNGRAGGNTPHPDVVGRKQLDQSTTELVSILNARADQIIEKLHLDINAIDKAALESQKKLQCFGDPYDETEFQPSVRQYEKDRYQQPRLSTNSSEKKSALCDRIAKETWDIGKELRALKDKFEDLHRKHVLALQNGELVLAREYSNTITLLLGEEYPRITAQNVGASPGAYATGYKETFVDTRNITHFRTPLHAIYQGEADKVNND